MDFKTGGQQVILRLVEAYGFSTRQMLCDHLGVSKSTLATRFMRDIFPAEWVIQCALETGVSLTWLVTGAGIMYENTMSDVITIPKMKIVDGETLEFGQLYLDKTLLKSTYHDLSAIAYEDDIYIVDRKENKISDGLWLITIDANTSIRNITRMPGGKIKVKSKSSEFECMINELEFTARVIFKLGSL